MRYFLAYLVATPICGQGHFLTPGYIPPHPPPPPPPPPILHWKENWVSSQANKNISETGATWHHLSQKSNHGSPDHAILQLNMFIIFTAVPYILILSKSFIYQLMHNTVALKILKFILKQLLHVSVQSSSSEGVLFELAKVIVVKIIS